jgi:hypothetical protein
MNITLADNTGPIVTHYRTDTSATWFDEWLQHLGEAELLLSAGEPRKDETLEERNARGVDLIKAEVAENGAVSACLSRHQLQQWAIALPWLPAGLTTRLPKRSHVWIIVHEQAAGDLRHIWGSVTDLDDLRRACTQRIDELRAER